MSNIGMLFGCVAFVLVLGTNGQYAADDWRSAPVIVGGTAGSGTRGVVQMLQRLGIYMAPPRENPLFARCMNGAINHPTPPLYPESGAAYPKLRPSVGKGV